MTELTLREATPLQAGDLVSLDGETGSIQEILSDCVRVCWTDGESTYHTSFPKGTIIIR